MKIKSNPIFKLLTLLFVLVLSATLFVACGKDGEKDPPPAETTVVLDVTTKNIYKYESFELKAEVKDGKAGDTVQWSVGDSAIAELSADGNQVTVLAKKEGVTDVTATLGNASAKCVVSVKDEGDEPVAVLKNVDQDETSGKNTVSVRLNNSLSVKASVSFRGNTYEDGTFTYETADSKIASVDDNGILKGIAVGETVLTVRGEWRGADPLSLTESVTVIVKGDTGIYIDADRFELYTSDRTGDETMKEIPFVVKVDGKEQADASVEWTLGTAGIVAVESADGVLTVEALKAGETTLTGSYEHGGKTYTTQEIHVKVNRSTFDESADVKQISTYDLTEETLKSLWNIEEDIVSISDVSSGSSKPLTVDGLKSARDYYGEKTWEITMEMYNLRVCVNAVTMVIRTPADLNQMLSVAKTQTPNVYNGYFVLANDIDYEGAAYAPTDAGPGYLEGSATGFSGILEGNGHVIKNIVLNNSLFGGEITYPGKVRNLGLEIDTLNTEWGAFCGFIGNAGEPSYAGPEFENLYIEVNGYTNGKGLFDGTTSEKLNGVILNFGKDVAIQNAVCGYRYGQPVATTKGLYVIVQNASAFSKATEQNGGSLFSGHVYESVADFNIEHSQTNRKELGFGMWNFIQLSAPATKNVHAGSEYDLTELFEDSFITVNTDTLPAGVTFEDGVLYFATDMQGGEITLDIRSTLPCEATEELVLNVVAVKVIEPFEIDVGSLNGKAYVTDAVLDGTIVSVTVAGKPVSGISYEAGKLTISYEFLNSLRAGTYAGFIETESGNYAITLILARAQQIIADAEEITLYSYKVNDSTHTTQKLGITVLQDGAEVSGKTITFESEDDSIATVSADGVVTAVRPGETNIIVSVDGFTFTLSVPVTVTISVRDDTAKTAIDADLNGGTASLEDIAAAAGLLGGETVTSIIDVTDPLNPVNAVIDAEGNIKGLASGENRIWEINGTTLGVKVKVTSITKVLYNLTDLNNMLMLGKTEAANTYAGYFVLGSNIEAAGGEYNPKSGYPTWFDGGNQGFIGTLDGRGYAINNLVLYNSLFGGGVGETAIIRNIALKGVVIAGAGMDWGIFSGSASKGALFENIYIDIAESPETNTVVDVLVHVGYGIRIRNIIVHLGENAPVVNAVYQADNTVCDVIENIYIIAENKTAYDAAVQKKYANTSVYDSEEAFKTGTAQTNWAEIGFVGYWDITAGKIPQLKPKA